MVEDGAVSHKIDYIAIIRGILNLEGHQNCNSSSKVTAIFLNGLTLPIGGASVVEGLLPKGLPRLIKYNIQSADLIHGADHMQCTHFLLELKNII